MIARAIVWAAGMAAAVAAQEVRLFSEWRRVGVDGAVVAADRGGPYREILSPSSPRNGYTSFQVVVSGPVGQRYYVHTGQNPEGSVNLTLFRAVPVNGIPDRLEKVEPPATGLFGETPESFWLDVWVPATAAVGRIRLEVQLSVGDRWIIYPMEVRIRGASIPRGVLTTGQLAAPAAPAVDTAVNVLKAYLCAKPGKAAEAAPSIRSGIRRNAAQDIALARALEDKHGRPAVERVLAEALGRPDVAAWCAEPKLEHPEAYFRVREALFKLAEE